MKKFELTTDFIIFCGIKLFRIRALIEFCDVKAGEVGGYIEKEKNLSQLGEAWVSGNAKVFGNALVSGNTWIYDNAKVSDNATVYDNAKVSDKVWIFGNAEIAGNAKVFGNTWIFGEAKVSGNAEVSGDADYTTIKGFGKTWRTTTFFREKDRIAVRCGCFYGGLDDFREKVKETYKDNKKGKEYLMIADLMEYHFKKEEE